MSRIISFAWTTPALLSGFKVCTRRDWDDRYAAKFGAGDRVTAFNRSPRVHGVEVATLRLTAAPVLEPLAAMPDGDYAAEGYAWMAAHPETLPKTIDGAPFSVAELGWPSFRRWQRSGQTMWVIRFELVAYHGPNILAHVKPAALEAIRGDLAPGVRGLAEAALRPATVSA